MFVINIHRPSDLPVKYFCDALNRLLKNLTPGIPEIVMGDFNVDLLSRKDDVITRTFSDFVQNIKSSSTLKLTCLDHIYTRHMKAQQAGVVLIYYSYHDMTYISVDMQQLQQNHLINIFRYY
jgi:endonuclease/exonuclease/phosphatase family metal-dependent hydrolase